MVRFRRIALIAVLVFSLSLTGCVGLLEDDSGDDSPEIDTDEYDAQTLAADAAASMSEAETYTFSSEQEFDVEEEQPGENTTLTVTVEADGAADESANVFSLDTQTLLGTDAGQLPVDGAVYVDGTTVNLEGAGRNWSQRTMDGPWSATGQEAALLQDASVEIAGTDSVDGHDTIVLEVDATEEAVRNYGFDENMAPDSRPSNGTVGSADVRLYVGAEAPHYVYRSEIETTVTGGDPLTIVDATFTRTYDDFGEDVDVERPEGLDG